MARTWTACWRTAVRHATSPVSGNSVWFSSSTYLWTTADGVHWARYSFHCPAPIHGEPYSLAGISAGNRSDVAFLCAAATGMYHTFMRVLVSFNGGRSEWQTLTAAGDPPVRYHQDPPTGYFFAAESTFAERVPRARSG